MGEDRSDAGSGKEGRGNLGAQWTKVDPESSEPSFLRPRETQISEGGRLASVTTVGMVFERQNDLFFEMQYCNRFEIRRVELNWVWSDSTNG